MAFQALSHYGDFDNHVFRRMHHYDFAAIPIDIFIIFGHILGHFCL